MLAMMIDLPIRVKGLVDNGCAAIYTTARPWFRFISVVNNTAYFQEPIEKANHIWAGNIFASENKDVKITVVADGQAEENEPLIEIHNPTYSEIKTRVFSPEKTPVFGGMSFNITLPAGNSVFFRI